MGEYIERTACYDCRGKEITLGCTVVVADTAGRLHERVVRMIKSRGVMATVHFERGGYTTPDRMAVVP